MVHPINAYYLISHFVYNQIINSKKSSPKKNMAGKAVYWNIQFSSKEEYHACLSTPSVLSYIRHKDFAEFDNEKRRYVWKIRLKKSTTVSNLKNIFHEFQLEFIQTLVRTQEPITRKMEYVKKKANKRLMKDIEKRRKEDIKLWRLIKQLE